MAYSKVFDAQLSGGGSTSGTPLVWEYLFATHMPSVGWTTEVRGANDNLTPTLVADRYWFCRKTLEFTDGTTAEARFVCELEYNGTDIMYYAWDGVKVTTDSSDPDYGLEQRLSDTSFLGFNTGRYEIWADGDSFFVLRDGYFQGMWLPNGGWVRQDYTTNAADTPEVIAENPYSLPAYDNGTFAYGTGGYNIGSGLPYEKVNADKLTDYVVLEGSGIAAWRDIDSQMLMRASSFGTDFSKYPKLIRIGDEDGGTYWFGPTATDDGYTFLFDMGNEDPGY